MRATQRKAWRVSALAVTALIAGVFSLAPPGAAQEAPSGSTAPPAATEQTSSETFQIGPFGLAPHGEPGSEVNRLGEVIPRPEGDIAVTGMSFRFVDENGDDVPADLAHLHHLVLLDSGRPDQLCSYPPASRFAGTGMELSEMQLPEGYGYHSPAGAPWLGVYHVMNMSDTARTVSVEYTVEYTEDTGDLLDVEPYFLDVTGCWGTSEYDVPGDGGLGSVHEQSNSYAMTREGYMVTGGGHLHDGGIDVTLSGPDGEVCRSEAVYDDSGGDTGHHGGGLIEVTPCGEMDEAFSVGDEYTLTSRYHNDEPISGAMGIMSVFMHHTDPPPPEPAVEVTPGNVTRDGIEVELSCANATEATIDAWLTQEKGNSPAVTANGHTTVPCEDDTVTIPLSGYGGMLTGGEATVDLWASTSGGGRGANDTVLGTVHVNGRIDLAGEPVPTTGLPIEIDGSTTGTEQGQVVTGTIECDNPTELQLSVDGHQRVGRNPVSFSGGQALTCDGTTAFAVPVSAWDGRLAGGPTLVSVRAYDPATFTDLATASERVHLRNEHPEENDEAAPDSPLSIVGAERTDDGIAVTLSLADCEDGTMAEFGADVSRIQGQGRRLPDSSAGWTYVVTECTGGETTAILPTQDVSGNRVGVDAMVWTQADDGSYASYATYGEVAVD